MTTYRHAVEDDEHGVVSCGPCYVIECMLCRSVTPDVSSRCGYVVAMVACGYPESDRVMHGPVYGHSYRPTRCTCGHAIEPVP